MYVLILHKIVSSFLSRRVVRIQAAMLGQSTWQENEGGLWETASKKQKPLFQQLTDSEYYQPPCKFGNRSFPGWASVETIALTELGGSPVWLLKMGTISDLLWVTGIILCSFLRWFLLWPWEIPNIPMHVLICTQMNGQLGPSTDLQDSLFEQLCLFQHCFLLLFLIYPDSYL